jgi:hypothetical protein
LWPILNWLCTILVTRIASGAGLKLLLILLDRLMINNLSLSIGNLVLTRLSASRNIFVEHPRENILMLGLVYSRRMISSNEMLLVNKGLVFLMFWQIEHTVSTLGRRLLAGNCGGMC